ncbi:MAG TPA: hypothetical protein VG488_02625 [Candidatus Angelobacter sp.]|jgi:hypothetical protein|nr:hypothetical protein [Candidatus Angelobacter sp.]
MKWIFFVFALCTPLAYALPAGQSPLVRDLQATRKGNKVLLTWTQPNMPTNRQSSTGPLVARVCRNISFSSTASGSPTCTQPAGQVPQKTSRATAQFTDTLSEDAATSDALQFAVYTLEVRDGRGRSAGFSNPVSIPLAPTLPVKGLHSELDAHGVYLIWENEIESPPSSLQFDYRVYRSEKDSTHRIAVPYLRGLIHTKEGERWTGVDTGIEWEKNYLYWITPITRIYSPDGKLMGEIEGEDSAPIVVVTHDIFPPAVPERLLTVVNRIPGKKFIDLLWAPNTEKDLAGYNVYRREARGQMAPINSAPITMLSFQDTDVADGHTYSYCISAVDIHGNESAKSPEITQALR